jgi:hypothetical protein
MGVEPEGMSPAEELHRRLFSRVGVDQARRVLAALLESPFFYRSDDPDLFGVLARNRNAFTDFFSVCFGWSLYVDAYTARVIRTTTGNRALSPKERQLFQWSGREEQVMFMLLLEFQEAEADRQNVDWSENDVLRFVLADYVEFAFKRYGETLNLDNRLESRLLNAAKELFRKLEEFRMLRRLEGVRGVDEFATEAREKAVYECLPGLRCYRAEAVETSGLLRVYSTADEEAEGDVSP